MDTPPELANEDLRLAVLQALNQLDTPAEERFDRIAELAKALFEVPIVLISLVDSERQWFKSRIGFDQQCSDRSISFCGHAIASQGVFVIPDALSDSRFADNPLVLGPPFIRFYAGAPLRITDELRLGTLCLIDSEARDLDATGQLMLSRMAAMVRDELLRLPAPDSRQLQHQAQDSAGRALVSFLRQQLAAR